ncbi:Small heat shock protein HSP16.5 [Candidatus Norongarragalina meridionalis]|nr:Small heat shock protein HSP16.5 [Candidatus Norongarragalina meridionalis]
MKKQEWDADKAFAKEFKHFFPSAEFEFPRPVLESFETASEVVVTAELPGVRKEDLRLNVSERGMELGVVRREHSEKHRGETHESSSRFSGFTRYVSFPCAVDASAAKASFRNGILEVRVPKKERHAGRAVRIG